MASSFKNSLHLKPNDRFRRHDGSKSSSLKCLEHARAVWFIGSALAHLWSHSALLLSQFGNLKNDKSGEVLLHDVHFATAQNGILWHAKTTCLKNYNNLECYVAPPKQHGWQTSQKRWNKENETSLCSQTLLPPSPTELQPADNSIIRSGQQKHRAHVFSTGTSSPNTMIRHYNNLDLGLWSPVPFNTNRRLQNTRLFAQTYAPDAPKIDYVWRGWEVRDQGKTPGR